VRIRSMYSRRWHRAIISNSLSGIARVGGT
jgi:hypothetical protein